MRKVFGKIFYYEKYNTSEIPEQLNILSWKLFSHELLSEASILLPEKVENFLNFYKKTKTWPPFEPMKELQKEQGHFLILTNRLGCCKCNHLQDWPLAPKNCLKPLTENYVSASKNQWGSFHISLRAECLPFSST